MKLSIHYYVLSLNNHTSKLYEGFRNQLIDVQNMGFPYHFPVEESERLIEDMPEDQLRASLIATNQHFNGYYEQDPLGLVIIGAPRSVAIFQSLMDHPSKTLGTISGDFTNFSPHDLEKVIWPVLMSVIAGDRGNALHNLDGAHAEQKLIYGIDDVMRTADRESTSTLFVEEDYHVPTSINNTGHSLIDDQYDNLFAVFNDVVDIFIERLLKSGGKVMFMESGTMTKYGRIALIQGG